MRSDLLAWAVRGGGLAIGAAAVVGAIVLAISAGGVLVLVFLSIVLAAALEPFVGWIRAHLPLGRGATILLVYAWFFAAVVALALVIVPAAYAQFTDVVAGLPPLLERAREWAAGLRPRGLATGVGGLVDAAERFLRPPAPRTDDVVRAGLTAAEAVASVATLLTIVYFWLVERARLQRYVLSFVPRRRRAGARDAWNEIETRLGLWARGQLLLMGIVGVATGVAYAVLGVPAALLLALVAALAEAVPLVGPLLGAIPAVLVAATVSPQLAIAVAGVNVIVQFVEGAVLVPLVMRNSVGLSPFLVIVSLLVGAAVGGLAGALLAVPFAAALEVVLARLQARAVPVAPDPAAAAEDDAEREALTDDPQADGEAPARI